jgi:hypothetical protein
MPNYHNLSDAPQKPKSITNYLVPALVPLTMFLVIYIAKNPETIWHNKTATYTSSRPIQDLNNDKFPELEVHHSDSTIDTLISHIENNQVNYRK